MAELIGASKIEVPENSEQVALVEDLTQMAVTIDAAIGAATDEAQASASAAHASAAEAIEVAQDALEAAPQERDGPAAWGIIGEDGRAIDVLMPDGTLAAPPLAGLQRSGESDAAWGIIGDDGRAIDVIMPDGTLAPRLTAKIVDGVGASLGLTRLSPTQATLHVGTSLTAGVNGLGYPPQLQALTGHQASNQGWAGRNSFVLASTWGALPLLTTDDITIPTSGSVSVGTTWEYGGGRSATIAGVTGTLTRVGATTSTFTPSAPPPAPVTVPAGSQVQVLPWADWSDRIFILECSRNDLPTLDPAVTASHMRDLIDTITGRSRTRRFLVMGEPLASTDSATDKAARQARNVFLRNVFPTAYVPAFEWLLADECAAYLGVTWTDQDRVDIAAGVTPSTLRSKDAGGVDTLHPNALGNKAIAYQLSLAMKNRGWIK